MEQNTANYKIQRCSIKDCSSQECFYYHNNLERRRNPYFFSYSKKPCSIVFRSGMWHNPNECPSGDMCPNSHTFNEYTFYPQRQNEEEEPPQEQQQDDQKQFKVRDALKKSLNNLNKMFLCVMCSNREFELVVDPCGHVVCRVCSENILPKCRLCNTGIEKFYQVKFD